MTTDVAPRGERTSVPTFRRLFTAELRRLAARRFTRVLLGICLIGYLVAVGFIWQSHARETPADIAQATAQRDQAITDFKQQNAQCLSQPGNTEQQCGPIPTADDFPVDQFLANNPFRPDDVQTYSLAVAVAVAMAGFVLGSTFIGAEWSSKNLVAWLFYEPRRLRLMWAKLLALSGVVLILSVVAQVLWALTARLLINFRGLPISSLGASATHFWSDVLHLQIRAVLLVVPAMLLGFGLANLIRNTAAALGVAFVYLAVVETVVRGISPSLQPYLFVDSVAAWVTEGGTTVFGKLVYDQRQGFVIPQQIHISNLHGGVTLLVYAGVVLAVSLLLFRRRDIT